MNRPYRTPERYRACGYYEHQAKCADPAVTQTFLEVASKWREVAAAHPTEATMLLQTKNNEKVSAFHPARLAANWRSHEDCGDYYRFL